MTDIEYEELKERLKADGIFVEKKATENSKKHEYFRTFNDYMNKLWEQDQLYAGWGGLHDGIRKAVISAYGARGRVASMPDDKKEEANQLAIDICKLVMDRRNKEDTAIC
jgi:spermidine synthase